MKCRDPLQCSIPIQIQSTILAEIAQKAEQTKETTKTMSMVVVAGNGLEIGGGGWWMHVICSSLFAVQLSIPLTYHPEPPCECRVNDTGKACL